MSIEVEDRSDEPSQEKPEKEQRRGERISFTVVGDSFVPFEIRKYKSKFEYYVGLAKVPPAVWRDALEAEKSCRYEEAQAAIAEEEEKTS